MVFITICTYHNVIQLWFDNFFWQILQFNKLKKIRSDQENLPIFQYRQMILDKLEQNQIVVVAGDTGCGKSTQVGGKGVVKKFNTLCQVLSINIAECGNIRIEWMMMWNMSCGMSTPLNLKADGGHIYKCDLQVK